MTEPSRIRKRQLAADAATSVRAAGEIDIVGGATIAYSSEDPAHPIEHAMDGCSGPGATRWISARPDTVERIVVEFDRPQAISQLAYEVEEELRERTSKSRPRSRKTAVEPIGRYSCRNILSARAVPPTSVKNKASTASRLAISVSRSFRTRMAPARRR
jgi:hypothetical protein